MSLEYFTVSREVTCDDGNIKHSDGSSECPHVDDMLDQTLESREPERDLDRKSSSSVGQPPIRAFWPLFLGRKRLLMGNEFEHNCHSMTYCCGLFRVPCFEERAESWRQKHAANLGDYGNFRIGDVAASFAAKLRRDIADIKKSHKREDTPADPRSRCYRRLVLERACRFCGSFVYVDPCDVKLPVLTLKFRLDRLSYLLKLAEICRLRQDIIIAEALVIVLSSELLSWWLDFSNTQDGKLYGGLRRTLFPGEVCCLAASCNCEVCKQKYPFLAAKAAREEAHEYCPRAEPDKEVSDWSDATSVEQSGAYKLLENEFANLQSLKDLRYLARSVKKGINDSLVQTLQSSGLM